MEDTFYHSNCTDKEDGISNCKPNLSLSGGYCPYKDRTDWKDSSSDEDSTSEASFCYSLPPIQEGQLTESESVIIGRGEQIHESEQLCGLPIVRVVDVYLGSYYEDALATLDLHRDFQWMDKYPRERMRKILWKMEVLMRYLKVFPDDLKDNDDDDDDDDDDDNEDEDDYDEDEDHDNGDYDEDKDDDDDEDEDDYDEDEDDEMISQETVTEDTLSVSSGQSMEGDMPTNSETTSCLSIRSIIHWFRKRVVSSLPGRKRRDTANKDPSLL
ncbi:uncharacterized protein C12orf71-like [Callospermophilus lateralis]|uniref:uncharacterized protein C12orf71-like n=1 Tax=Callospermophilus lateralis TaxID=76772 RepID=UPI004053D111